MLFPIALIVINVLLLRTNDPLTNLAIASISSLTIYSLSYIAQLYGFKIVLYPSIIATLNLLYAALSHLAIQLYYIDVFLIGMLLALTVYCWSSIAVRNAFSHYTPIAILIGVITGASIGLNDPLKYSILALIDVLSLSRVFENYGFTASSWILAMVMAASIYTNPVFYTSFQFICSSIVILAAKIALLPGKRYQWISSIDIAFRPVLAGLMT